MFEQGNIEVLNSLGFEVHAAANYSDANERLNELNIVRHHFDIERSPFSLKNIKAFKQIREIMRSEKFDAVHCHSPMGGVLARLAAKCEGIPFVLYTAHGFHFFKGAPLTNWLLYYPIEKWLSVYTDILITINKEDYNAAKKLKSRDVKLVSGIGVDVDYYKSKRAIRETKRRQLGIAKESFVILSIGEMISRKNHRTAIEAISKLNSKSVLYLICGKGPLEKELNEMVVNLGLESNVLFLGYRNDISEICAASDLFLFPSFQEGLPVAVMEGMAAGLPVVCSEIRGNIDLIDKNKGGFLVESPINSDEFAKYINVFIDKYQLINEFGNYNMKKIQKYSLDNVKDEMKIIYSKLNSN